MISLPSLTPENEEATLKEWEYTSNMTLFGSNYGANKEKVIAPGMSNSVEIVIDNRNGGALDYEIDFNFMSGQEDYWIPLQVKITRYDGTLLTDDYMFVGDITDLSDTHTIGGNSYGYYLVEWYWPNSENDNIIGDLALEKDMKVFASINAKSWKSESQNSTNGVSRKYVQETKWMNINIGVGSVLASALILTSYALFTLKDPYLTLEEYPVPKKGI